MTSTRIMLQRDLRNLAPYLGSWKIWVYYLNVHLGKQYNTNLKLRRAYVCKNKSNA